MTRLERLARLRFLCMTSELSADPCTPERAARARRADRIAAAHRAERAVQAHTEPCGFCGQPARTESGLCDQCEDKYTHHQAEEYVYWQVGA